MPEIIASQLIYTNVEADVSPARVRGFQLWCHTEGLDDAVVTEARRRLENFKNPDATRHGRIVRTLFADVGNDHFLLAQTTPQETTDKFGRKGRFHAHALILPTRELEKVRFNPFALLDVFRFDESPDETMGKRRPTDLRYIDAVPVACLEEPKSRVGEWDPLIDRLAEEHLPRMAAEDKDSLPVCFAEKPDVILDRLRGLFHLLPATLRRTATFDTVCYGSAVAANYFVVANPDERLASTLSGFRYYFINKQGITRPKPTPRPAGSSLDWFPAFWKKGREVPLPDGEREAAFVFLRALHDRPGELDAVARPADSLLTFLAGFPEVEAAITKLAEGRLRRDYARAFDPKGLPRIGGGLHGHVSRMDLPAKLAFVRDGFAPGLVTEEIYQTLEERTTPIMKPDRDAIRKWVTDAPPEKAERVRLMLARWSEHEGSFERCLNLLSGGEQSDRRTWFFSWCRNTLRPLLESAARDADLLRTLLSPRQLTAVELREMRLLNLFVFRPAGDAAPEIAELAEAVVADDDIPVAQLVDDEEPHRKAHAAIDLTLDSGMAIDLLLKARQLPAGESLTRLVESRPEAAGFLAAEWLVRKARQHETYLITKSGEHFLGVELTFDAGEDGFLGRLADALLSVKPVMKWLRGRLFEFVRPDRRRDLGIKPLWSESVSKNIARIMVSVHTDQGATTRRLLAESDNTLYLGVANEHLLDRTRGVECSLRRSPGRFFLGWRVELINSDRKAATLGLLEALASSLFERGTEDDPEERAYFDLKPDTRHRHEWLLRRIDRPVETESAPLYAE